MQIAPCYGSGLKGGTLIGQKRDTPATINTAKYVEPQGWTTTVTRSRSVVGDVGDQSCEWGLSSQEEQWQSLHKKPSEAHPGCASEEEDRRTTITRLSSKRSNSLREGSREPNSDNGIMLLIHNLYTRTSVYTVALEVSCDTWLATFLNVMYPQCWSSFNYLAYLHKILQLLHRVQWHRRGAHCWPAAISTSDNVLQSLKFAPVRTSSHQL